MTVKNLDRYMSWQVDEFRRLGDHPFLYENVRFLSFLSVIGQWMVVEIYKEMIILNIVSLERVWRKGNPLTLLVGMQTSTATMENSVEIP